MWLSWENKTGNERHWLRCGKAQTSTGMVLNSWRRASRVRNHLLDQPHGTLGRRTPRGNIQFPSCSGSYHHEEADTADSPSVAAFARDGRHLQIKDKTVTPVSSRHERPKNRQNQHKENDQEHCQRQAHLQKVVKAITGRAMTSTFTACPSGVIKASELAKATPITNARGSRPVP